MPPEPTPDTYLKLNEQSEYIQELHNLTNIIACTAPGHKTKNRTEIRLLVKSIGYAILS
jgi:hypothetical protein